MDRQMENKEKNMCDSIYPSGSQSRNNKLYGFCKEGRGGLRSRYFALFAMYL